MFLCAHSMWCYVQYGVGGSTETQVDHKQPVILKPVAYNNRNSFRQREMMRDLNLQPPRSTLYSETIGEWSQVKNAFICLTTRNMFLSSGQTYGGLSWSAVLSKQRVGSPIASAGDQGKLFSLNRHHFPFLFLMVYKLLKKWCIAWKFIHSWEYK